MADRREGRGWVGWLVAATGFVFLASAVLKVLAPVDFAVQVSYYGIVRTPWVVLTVAHATIVLEALVGVLLISASPWRRAASWTALGLLVAFTGLIAFAWAFRGLEDCGCFGKFVHITPGWSMVKNAALVAMVAPFLWCGRRARGGAEEGAEAVSLWRRWRAVAVASGVALAMGAVAIGMTVRESGDARSAVSQTREGETRRAETGETGGDAPKGEAGERPAGRNPLRGRFEAPGGSVDLSSGTYLVAMLSESCDHCAETVRRLNALTKNPDMPVLVGYVLGDAESLRRFRDTHKPAFPTQSLPPLDFLPHVGAAPPRLLLTRDGRRATFWDGKPPEAVAILEAMLDVEEGAPSRGE